MFLLLNGDPRRHWRRCIFVTQRWPGLASEVFCFVTKRCSGSALVTFCIFVTPRWSGLASEAFCFYYSTVFRVGIRDVLVFLHLTVVWVGIGGILFCCPPPVSTHTGGGHLVAWPSCSRNWLTFWVILWHGPHALEIGSRFGSSCCMAPML